MLHKMSICLRNSIRFFLVVLLDDLIRLCFVYDNFKSKFVFKFEQFYLNSDRTTKLIVVIVSNFPQQSVLELHTHCVAHV